MTALHELTIAEAAALLRSRALTAEALATAHLDRIASLDRTLHAFITVTAETALADARRADSEIAAGHWRGPLHGIPLALKDVIDIAGVRTTCHSRLRLNHVAQEDADCVDRLKKAGAIFLGKLATHEFAFGGPSHDLPFPAARNPWAMDRVTGGSSSGSGAAVAAGLCMGSIGTDTSGSIRMPAGHCGIVGLKPTYGRVSRHGVFPLSPTLDHVGPLSWTVKDCALLLAAIADEGFPAPVTNFDEPVAGLRIGIDVSWHHDHADPAMHAAFAETIAVWRKLGVDIVELRLPSLTDMNACGRIILLSEGYAIHKATLTARPTNYGRLTRDRMRLGAFVAAEEYLRAQRLRRRFAAQMNETMQSCDAVISPIHYRSAERFDEATETFPFFGLPFLTMPFSLTGQPALAVPCGESSDGLPLGLQIAAAAFREDIVLRLGHALETVLGRRHHRAPGQE